MLSGPTRSLCSMQVTTEPLAMAESRTDRLVCESCVLGTVGFNSVWVLRLPTQKCYRMMAAGCSEAIFGRILRILPVSGCNILLLEDMIVEKEQYYSF